MTLPLGILFCRWLKTWIDFRTGKGRKIYQRISVRTKTPAFIPFLQRKSSSLSTSDLMWATSRTIHTASPLSKQYVDWIVAAYIHFTTHHTAVSHVNELWVFLSGVYLKVIPAKGSSTIHVSFTPLTLSGSVCESRCVGLALGFMSLDTEVTRSWH